jgi:ribosome-associated protein
MDTKAPDSPPHAPFDEDEVEDFGRSRTSLKKERINNELALTELAVQLKELTASQLLSLGVSDHAIEAIEQARSIKSYGARDRQLRLIRTRLRALDWMLVRAKLDQKRAGVAGQTLAPSTDEARVWTEQLIVQQDDGLSRFMGQYENANRQRIRQLMRTVLQTGEAKRHKARQLLLSAISDVLANHAASRKKDEESR